MSKGSSNQRIPFPTEGDPEANFEEATRKALELAQELPGIHTSPLKRLSDLQVRRYGSQESQGATYRQLGFIAHRVGMDSQQRSEWYWVAKDVPLSGRHASHIAARLTDDEADEVEELEDLWSKDAGEER